MYLAAITGGNRETVGVPRPESDRVPVDIARVDRARPDSHVDAISDVIIVDFSPYARDHRTIAVISCLNRANVAGQRVVVN